MADTLRLTAPAGGGKLWVRTTALRILRKPGPYGAIDKLQQGWECIENGQIKWEDVEVITTDPAGWRSPENESS